MLIFVSFPVYPGCVLESSFEKYEIRQFIRVTAVIEMSEVEIKMKSQQRYELLFQSNYTKKCIPDQIHTHTHTHTHTHIHTHTHTHVLFSLKEKYQTLSIGFLYFQKERGKVLLKQQDEKRKGPFYALQMRKINGLQVVLTFLSYVLWTLFICKLWGQQSRKWKSLIRQSRWLKATR